MKLVCVICESVIQVGEPLLANTSGELAHQSCVESKSEVHVQLPSVTLPSPSVAAKILIGAVTPISEPCLPPARQKTCVVCERPCIGACPCGALVCQAYGWEKSCGLSHEATCSLAKDSRQPNPKISGWQLPGGQGAKLNIVAYAKGPIYDTIEVDTVDVPRNGKHKTKRNRKGRR